METVLWSRDENGVQQCVFVESGSGDELHITFRLKLFKYEFACSGQQIFIEFSAD